MESALKWFFLQMLTLCTFYYLGSDIIWGMEQQPRGGQWPMLSDIWGSFLLLLLHPSPQIPVSRPKFQCPVLISVLRYQPRGLDFSLKVQISVKGPRSHPHGWNLGLKAGIWASRLRFGPLGWNLGLKTGIRFSRLGLGPQNWNLGLETGI